MTGIKGLTADEAIDSKCDMGSPTYFTVFLKYRSWLKTFSACKRNFLMSDQPN